MYAEKSLKDKVQMTLSVTSYLELKVAQELPD